MEELLHEDKTFEKLIRPGQKINYREFENCTFKACDFSDGDFSNSRFTDCTFIGCNLAMLKLSHSTLNDVTFKECKLTGINFGACEDFLFTVRFEGCILDYATFQRKKMAKTKFINTSLKGVDFSGATLTGSQFSNTDLERAVFDRTILQEADFSTAYNFDIDPEQNTIKKAKFSQFGLQGLLTKYNLKVV